jgi:lysophospholipase L1-like esterase
LYHCDEFTEVFQESARKNQETMNRKIVALVVLASIATCTTAFPAWLGNIMPLGDSITRGSPVPGGYREGLLNRLKDYDFKFVGNQSDNGSTTLTEHGQSQHEGHGSYTIQGIDNNLNSYLNTIPNPDYVLLLIGTNDFIGGSGENTAINRLDALLGHLTTALPNANIIVSNLILRADSATEESHIQTLFNARIPGLVRTRAANGEKVSFVDMHSIVTLSDLSADGVHPARAGYNKMADAWLDAIQATQAAEPTTLPMCASILLFLPLLLRRRKSQLPGSVKQTRG